MGFIQYMQTLMVFMRNTKKINFLKKEKGEENLILLFFNFNS